MLSSLFLRLTRSRLIVTWFAIIAFSGAIAIVLGSAPTFATLATLFALALVPPAILMMLWPGVQPLTAAEVIRGERRGR